MDNIPVVSDSSSSKQVEKWLESFIPYYLVMDILSRLHVKNVIQCRCVCKSWRDLLSTPEFLGLYKERGMGGNWQLILVDEPKIKRRIKLFYLDEWQFSSKPIVRRIHRYPSYRTEFSQEGFLVMSSFCDHIILIANPIETKGVKILCKSWLEYRTNAYGIFFNPTLKVHCVLLGVTFEDSDGNDSDEGVSYRMLTLGANPSWRHLGNPFNHGPMFHTSTQEWTRPVLVGDYLYWLVAPGLTWTYPSGFKTVYYIMEFNTRTEEFILIPIPLSQSNNGISTPEIGLLNIDGFISSVQTFTSRSDGFDIDVEIDVWTLKDRVAQTWTNSMYHVTVDYDLVDFRSYSWKEAPKPIAVEYGQLIFQFHTVLFAFNLMEKTIRICGKEMHNENTRFFCHSISLSSLKNCTPVICMEGVDEYEYKESCKVCSKLFKEETPSAGVNKHSDVVEEPSTSNLDDGGDCKLGTCIPEQINPTSSKKL